MNERDIIDLIESDNWMMSVLLEAEKLNLPDWMIMSGFLRNKVWNHLHGIQREEVDTNDIDLVYFDPTTTNEEIDKNLSLHMKSVTGLEWDIINQAYTHNWHNHDPYKNTTEALSYLVETSTCVAITLQNGELSLNAPHGIDDLVNSIVRPTPFRAKNLALFYKRIEDKQWLSKWPKLKIIVD